MSSQSTTAQRVAALREWYRRPLGGLLAETEQEALSARLATLFGYHLVVVEPPWEECPLEDSRIPHRFIQSISPDDRAALSLAANTDDWPIMTDSVDAIILPHTLELSANPHQVLREADRSLIPDGHLVILGFNPYGPWGLRRAFSRRRGRMPWDSRFLGLGRIRDWLGLLGFDTIDCHYLFQRPPFSNLRLLEKINLLEPASGRGRMLFSAAYILVAQKRTAIVTPVKPLLPARRRLFPVGVPGSGQGNVHRVRRH